MVLSGAGRMRRSRRASEDDHNRPHSATSTRSKFAFLWPRSG
jgi:hypothetical protein